jgi:hypothetical protein
MRRRLCGIPSLDAHGGLSPGVVELYGAADDFMDETAWYLVEAHDGPCAWVAAADSDTTGISRTDVAHIRPVTSEAAIEATDLLLGVTGMLVVVDRMTALPPHAYMQQLEVLDRYEAQIKLLSHAMIIWRASAEAHGSTLILINELRYSRDNGIRPFLPAATAGRTCARIRCRRGTTEARYELPYMLRVHVDWQAHGTFGSSELEFFAGRVPSPGWQYYRILIPLPCVERRGTYSSFTFDGESVRYGPGKLDMADQMAAHGTFDNIRESCLTHLRELHEIPNHYNQGRRRKAGHRKRIRAKLPRRR